MGPDGVAAAEPVAQAIEPGARIGRFVVIDELGRGGIGVVLAAYDPELDRRVAIKLLRAEAAGGSSTSHGRARLQREARAMANLSHPNVLTIYDVGLSGDRVFVAMEFADGGTLRHWLAERPRTWREVVDVHVQAGRGLEAAHRAGLVHRDFKPDNVLMTHDARVLVADFGLVGVAAAAAPSDDGGLPVDLAATMLTREGALLGTPAYMAPEQHLRQQAGPAADQFAFCVALFEGLYARRPFIGPGLTELSDNVVAGRIEPVPSGVEVPGWVREVVLRGLRPDPAQRYPSMGELLAALDSDPQARRRRRLAAGGMVLGVAALAGVAMYGLTRGGPVSRSPCQDAGDRLAGVWDPAVRQAMEAAFRGSRRSYAGATFTRVAAQLDARAAAWTEARTQACEDTHLRGEQSEALLDLRMACLDRHLGELAALTRLFAERPDPEVVDAAGRAVDRLPPLETCADTAALTAVVPLPADPAARDRAAALRDRLAEIRARLNAGQRAGAITSAREAVAEARSIGHPVVLADALYLQGIVQRDGADAELTLDTLAQAARFAALGHADALTAEIWLDVFFWVSYAQGRHADARLLLPLIDAAVARTGPDDRLQARLLNNLGILLDEEGRYEEAQQHYRRSLALRQKLFGPVHREVAASLNNLADSLRMQGRYQEARAQIERAIHIKQTLEGPDHPDVVLSLVNLGAVLLDAGMLDDARVVCERALAGLEAVHGPDHDVLVTTLGNLGAIRHGQGDHQAARAHLERARRLATTGRGTEDPAVAYIELQLGPVLRDLGDLAGALAMLEHARAAFERAYGPDHLYVASALHASGTVLHRLDRRAEARRAYEGALARYRKILGPDSARAAPTLVALGQLLAAGGDLATAQAHLEQGFRMIEGGLQGPRHPTAIEAKLALAEVLLRRGRAAEAAARAEEALAALGQGSSPEHRRAQALLARVRGRR